MKQLLAIGKTSEDAKAAFSYLEKYFGVQIFEQSIDTAKGIVGAMKPDMILVSVEELLLSPTMALNELQKECEGIPVVTYGKVEDFVRFEKLYVGEPLENLKIPFDEDAALFLVCSKLKISMKKLKQESANKKTILVIDDDATTLRSMKSILDNKYNVELANSGEKAFQMMEKKVPDLVLLDYDMPVMNGKEVLEKIRATKEYANLPAIFVTAVTDKSNITSLVSLRPSGYLLKPITMDVLLAEIEKVLK